LESAHYITKELDAEFERSRLEGGEVLLSIQGTIGRTAIVPTNLRGANISRTLAVVAPDARLDRHFLYYYFRFLAVAGRYETGGSTRASLNIGTIRRMQVPVPPLVEQRRIVDAIEVLFSRIDAADTSIRQGSLRVEHLRQSTINELFGRPDWEWTTFGEVADIKGGAAPVNL
jgi:type I restriction enzyme S subunit